MASLKYKDKDGFWQEFKTGATVVANPILTGTEAELAGLQVGETKYKIPTGGGSGGGGKLYRHNIMISNFVQVSSFNCPAYLEIYLTEGTEFTTFSALWEAMKRPSNLFVKIFYQNYIGNCFMAIGGSPSSVILRGSVPTSNNNIELMPSPMQDYASKNIVDTVTEL